MNKRSFYTGMSIAMLGMCTVPLFAEGLVGPESPNGQFFGTVDYFLAGDVADDIETSFNEAAVELTGMGDPSTASTDVSDGVGGRIGYLRNLNPHFALGGSLGYLVGPEIDAKLTTLPGGVTGIYGDATLNVKTSYLRFMAEGVGKLPLSKKVSLNLGVAMGAAQAKTEQEASIYYTDGFGVIAEDFDSDESTLGFSWEISPSVDLNLEKIALSFGLRYSQFPKIKESDDTDEIDWKAVGFFAGLKF